MLFAFIFAPISAPEFLFAQDYCFMLIEDGNACNVWAPRCCSVRGVETQAEFLVSDIKASVLETLSTRTTFSRNNQACGHNTVSLHLS